MRLWFHKHIITVVSDLYDESDNKMAVGMKNYVPYILYDCLMGHQVADGCSIIEQFQRNICT